MAIMPIYVNDLLLTGNGAIMIAEIKHILNSDFKMKDLGELNYFLRFEILRSNKGILLSQRKYALELIEDTGLGGAKHVITPMEQNMKLTIPEYDTELQQYDNDEVLTEEKEIFQRLIGSSKIIWLKGLLMELGAEDLKPAELYCDSKMALQIAANPVFHERTKYIEIDCHFIIEKIQEGVTKKEQVVSTNQLDDIMTKALGTQHHDFLMSKLGIKNVFRLPT
ncbi:hypothetical protein J1N35_007975 [Gossypium stocksii]|uniref:Reverse transcriptase Ty1/copia-type domain-containing protein n=1 Tax=Gossypium stocksii TaxID=47602 RepID=A0A9D4ADY5_9ROSI|nr:hypothetical protein J1N35_007975 [Gossypium stocksii]